ncbi:hypothetical protein NECAME_12793 [Necator americanus]|uniref:Uncharacterized protein n=1 Tax=Necator americanus TaxID=51031 RepID=W2SY59_NECAM|nr:hypothetical protein NECAME_12793 [Necator americanus]ETN74704.1 hypothetical protein NECAME_12793 [Necator americanus]
MLGGLILYFARRTFYADWYRGMYKRYGCDASGVTGGVTGSQFGATSTGGLQILFKIVVFKSKLHAAGGLSTMGTTTGGGTTGSNSTMGTTGGGSTMGGTPTSTSGGTTGGTEGGTTGGGTTGGDTVPM